MNINELIQERIDLSQKVTSYMQTLSLEERTSQKPTALLELFERRKLNEEKIINFSKEKPLDQDLFKNLPIESYRDLLKKGLQLEIQKIEVKKVTPNQYRKILNVFYDEKNLDLIFRELCIAVISENRKETLNGRFCVTEIQMIWNTNPHKKYVILIDKYLRQNLRVKIMKAYPLLYDRNSFNIFFDQKVLNSNSFREVHMKLSEKLGEFILHVSGKFVEDNGRKKMSNSKLLNKLLSL